MINKLITNAVSKAFDNSLKDAVTPFTGLCKGFGGEQGEYDPVTGEYTNTNGETGDNSYSGRGTFGSFTKNELLVNGIDINDTKLTCLVAEVTAIPKVDDEITFTKLGQVETLRIINVQVDNAEVAYSIQLRGLANVG